jgi:hypothetical protein
MEGTVTGQLTEFLAVDYRNTTDPDTSNPYRGLSEGVSQRHDLTPSDPSKRSKQSGSTGKNKKLLCSPRRLR